MQTFTYIDVYQTKLKLKFMIIHLIANEIGLILFRIFLNNRSSYCFKISYDFI